MQKNQPKSLPTYPTKNVGGDIYKLTDDANGDLVWFSPLASVEKKVLKLTEAEVAFYAAQPVTLYVSKPNPQPRDAEERFMQAEHPELYYHRPRGKNRRY